MTNKKKGRSGKPAKAQLDEDATSGKIVYSIATAKDFFQEVQSEFNKIAWPNKKVTSGLTVFVLILVVILSMYLGSVDLLLGKLVSMVLQ